MNIPHTLTRTLFFLATITSLCFVSCSKDTNTKPKTAAELITQAPWHWTKKQLSNKGGAPVEQPLSTIQTTAVYTFKADGTFTVVGNADGSTAAGTWSLTDEKTVTLTFKDDDGITEVVPFAFTVTETAFVMTVGGTFYSFNPDGTSVKWDTEIITYTHV